ncbi:hypothetical protein LWI29_030891 [Acer saccharum]|uniref:Disease resistance R13L4/SHOC-2-like LRR domain-containing protein n=1 Tax=Acer saccharum TaxID=4024 RepID=A0AA39VS87_ACESA|nr:hypothetical protein LWI29_030891 [Acer saccharum]
MTEFTDALSKCTNCSLEFLHLGYNKLGGFLPDSLGHLKNLKHLLLMGNSFLGSIPESIGNLSSLKEFYLSENGMKGTIPVSLGQLSSLVALDLKNNQWEGTITEAHLSNLTSLKDLSIVLTSLNITLFFNVSSDWIPPFKLTYLSLKNCQLGPGFPMWLRYQNELEYVAFCNNKISGTIPDWFLKLDLILYYLEISNNLLSGTVPNTIKFSPQAAVILNYNRFTGPLPVLSSNGVVSSARSEEEGCVTRVAAKRWSGFDSRRRGGLNLDSGLQQRLIHNLGLVGAKIRRLDFVGNKRRGIGRREEIGLGN